MVKCELNFGGINGDMPALQVFAMNDEGQVMASSPSDIRFGSICRGGISWRNSTVEFLEELAPTGAKFFPIIIHEPSRAKLVGYSLFNNQNQLLFKGDPVDLTQGNMADWFVVSLGRFRSQDGVMEFKNISSFPNTSGDVVPQLKDLVHWIQNGDPAERTEGWIACDLTKTITVHDGQVCSECERKDEKIRSLQLQIEKQNILIEKLRKERRTGFVSDLIGPETLDVLPDDSDEKETNVEKLLQTQDELIGSIKEQILKLSNQIKNGQRLRAISS
jgi:hypothetical protein